MKKEWFNAKWHKIWDKVDFSLPRQRKNNIIDCIASIKDIFCIYNLQIDHKLSYKFLEI